MRAVTWFLLVASLAPVALGSVARAQDADGLDVLNHKVEQLHAEGKDVEALPLAKRYVALTSRRYGEDTADYATALSWLASLYASLGQPAEAEELFQRALAIRQRVLGPEHAQVATSLSNLAALYRSQGRNAEANPLARRAAEILNKGEGTDELDALQRQIQELQGNGQVAEAIPLAEAYVARARERSARSTRTTPQP
jgi:tetratricopeptide (TPR) repeat protein